MEEVASRLADHGVRWTFNLEKAPWWGGFFERTLRCVKRCLKKILHLSKVTYEELLTTLLEIEAILNSRPLSYVSSEDMEEPLTPSHLIYGRRVLSCPMIDPDDVDLATVQRDDVLRRLVHIKQLTDHFWTRWQAEYLLELRNAHRKPKSASRGAEVGVGDIVVIHEDGVARGLWNLARVEKLLPSKDGQVRGAVVKHTTKGGRVTCLRRPLQRLYPVELGEHRESNTPDDVTSADSVVPAPVTQPSVPEPRASRAAATRANSLRQQLILQGRV